MLERFSRKEQVTPTDGLIDAVLSEMHRVGVHSPEYPAMLDHLERLHKLKLEERQPRVSRDTLAIIAGNLLGILVIVAYEQKHVITSKGFTQIIRPKGT